MHKAQPNQVQENLPSTRSPDSADRRRWIGTLLVAAALTTTGSAFAETKLLFSTFFPSGHPLYAKVFVPWAKDVEAATQGRVRVEFAASSLAPPTGQLDMVQKGIADITAQFAGVVPKRMSPELVTELPGPRASAVKMSHALWATHEKYFSKDERYKGMQLLSLFAFPAQEFFCMKACFSSVDEMRSAKIATTPGTAARQYGALTSGIVAGPAVRYFEVVSKGIVDAYAAVTPIEVFAFNLAPSTKAMLRYKDLSTAGSFSLVVNAERWKSIGTADRDAIMKLSGAAFGDRMAELDMASEGAKKKMVETGMMIVDASDSLNADLKKAFAFLDEEWIKDVSARRIDATSALRYYREQLLK